MQIVLGYWPFRQPTVSVTAGGNFQWNFPPHQRWMRLHFDVFDTNPFFSSVYCLSLRALLLLLLQECKLSQGTGAKVGIKTKGPSRTFAISWDRLQKVSLWLPIEPSGQQLGLEANDSQSNHHDEILDSFRIKVQEVSSLYSISCFIRAIRIPICLAPILLIILM